MLSLEEPKTRPWKIVLYGPPGVGKTTFGTGANNPVFIRTEDGLKDLSTPRFPICKQLEDFYAQAKQLVTEKHDRETVVIDSLDWLETLAHTKVCRDLNITSLGDLDYGKAYSRAEAEFNRIRGAFDAIIDRGITVLAIAHSTVKPYSAPDVVTYDRYQLKLRDKASALFCEWADLLFFLNNAPPKQDKGLALASDQRVIHCKRSAAFDAKARTGKIPFPAVIKPAFSEIERYVGVECATLRERLSQAQEFSEVLKEPQSVEKLREMGQKVVVK